MDELMREFQQMANEMLTKVAELETVDQWSKNPQYPREATDRSGSVHVTLSDNNLPDEITIYSKWATGDTRLDAAIIEAIALAVNNAWVRAEEEWQAGSNQVPPVSADIRDYGISPNSKPLGISEILELSQQFQEDAKSTSADATSSEIANSTRTIRVKVGRFGLLDCTIDQDWARSQSPADLNKAVNQTFTLAHEALRRVAESARSAEERANEVISQALGYITKLTEEQNSEH